MTPQPATMTAERALAEINKRMSERAFQWRVVALARQLGWKDFHQFDSRRSQPGWPDLVLMRPPRIVAMELKSERGRVTAEQQATLVALNACGIHARCLRPSDWREIQETLL